MIRSRQRPSRVSTGDPRLDNNEFFENRLKATSEKVLALHGFEEATPATADLVIHYHANVRETIDVNELDRRYGYCDTCSTTIYNAGTITLAAVAVIQAVDTSRGWLYDSPYLHTRGGAYASKFTAPFWSQAGDRYAAIRIAPHSLDHYLDIATFARSHKMTTDSAYLSRTSTKATETTRQRLEQSIASGKWPADTLFILDEDAARRASATLDRTRNFLARADGVIVLAPNWTGCTDCGTVPYR